MVFGVLLGFLAWFFARYGLGGFYTIEPNERAVVCTFGRAPRLPNLTTHHDPALNTLDPEERARYVYPQVRIVGPGFYWKFPWQSVHRASMATETVSIAFDPEVPTANDAGTMLEAVTKDQLNTGLKGQIRYSVSDRNLYAYLFGVRQPVAHVMGYFVSVLRDRIANFEIPHQPSVTSSSDQTDGSGPMQGISINDLRKNLRSLNERMEYDCAASVARYGIRLDAALITGIDPPPEVDSALAAINTAHNHVSSEVSLAQAAADQRIVQSRRAVEIETLNAQAEVEPLLAVAEQLRELGGTGGPSAVAAYVRNAKLGLLRRAHQVVLNPSSTDGGGTR